MIKKEDVYKIGRLGKPHGVKGEITFQFQDDVFDRVDADYLIIEVDGILVPFFIEEYRFRSDEVALLKLEDIDTQEAARQLTNSDVYFERRLSDEDEDRDSSLFTLHFLSVIVWSMMLTGRKSEQLPLSTTPPPMCCLNSKTANSSP